jgi:hypothetical protein
MKKVKLFIVTFLISLVSMNSFSQEKAQEKIEEKVAEMVKEMSVKLDIARADKLTAEQEKQLSAAYLEKINEIKIAKNEISDKALQKEKIKEINKNNSKKIFDTILTPAQKAAIKKYRQTTKD